MLGAWQAFAVLWEGLFLVEGAGGPARLSNFGFDGTVLDLFR